MRVLAKTYRTTYVRRQNFEELVREVKLLRDRMRVLAKTYRIENKALGNLYYKTNIRQGVRDGFDEYDGASIAGWELIQCGGGNFARGAQNDLPHMEVDGKDDLWIIAFDGTAFTECESVEVDVLFWPRALMINGHYHFWPNGVPSSYNQVMGYDRDDE